MILLLSGYRGSGKDLMADHLVKNYGFRRVAFADKLKETTSDLFSIPLHYTHDRKLKDRPLPQYPIEASDDFSHHVNDFMKYEFGGSNLELPLTRRWLGKSLMGIDSNGNESQVFHTPRSLCILIGSVMRSVDKNYWVKNAIKDCGLQEKIVISDWRYVSEVVGLEEFYPGSVLTIRINRFENSTSNDPSERDLDNFDFDFVIDNKATVEDYKRSVDTFMKGLVANESKV